MYNYLPCSTPFPSHHVFKVILQVSEWYEKIGTAITLTPLVYSRETA